jgi:hypothetical protein
MPGDVGDPAIADTLTGTDEVIRRRRAIVSTPNRPGAFITGARSAFRGPEPPRRAGQPEVGRTWRPLGSEGKLPDGEGHVLVSRSVEREKRRRPAATHPGEYLTARSLYIDVRVRILVVALPDRSELAIVEFPDEDGSGPVPRS